MAKTYCIYRIRVTTRDRTRVEKWDAQHQDQGQPSGVLRYQEKLSEIVPLLQDVRNNKLNDSTLMKSFGEALFDVLFDDVLRQDFVNFYYEVVQKKQQILRVELDIDEQAMPDIAALPWEFMRVPAQAKLGKIWMGTLPNLVLSRRRSQWMAAQPIQLEPNERLRIALVVSAPVNLQAVAYEPVQAVLKKLAVEQAHRVELLPIVSKANPREIDAVLSKQPHIFHFIGHGRMQNEDQQEIGEMALVDPDFDEAMWVDADNFSELFNKHRPGVVILQACEGGMLSSSQAFVGVASELVQQNVAVVVAMQYEVTNSTACCFALEFYQNLAQDYPVDLAVQYGRRAIALGSTEYKKRDFATPVIFMRVQNGYLFNRQENLPQSRSNTSSPTRKHRVLVVDDHPNWCKLIQAVLSRHGYQVDPALTYDDARNLLEASHFDLVIVDRNLDDQINLEEGDGIGLSLLMFAHQTFPEMKKILISATKIDSHGSVGQYITPYGLREIICKANFKEQELVETVNRLFYTNN